MISGVKLKPLICVTIVLLKKSSNQLKQLSIGVLKKRCSENTHAKIWFHKSCFATLHECSTANLLHVFRTPFHKNISGKLILNRRFWTFKFNNGHNSKLTFLLLGVGWRSVGIDTPPLWFFLNNFFEDKVFYTKLCNF